MANENILFELAKKVDELEMLKMTVGRTELSVEKPAYMKLIQAELLVEEYDEQLEMSQSAKPVVRKMSGRVPAPGGSSNEFGTGDDNSIP